MASHFTFAAHSQTFGPHFGDFSFTFNDLSPLAFHAWALKTGAMLFGQSDSARNVHVDLGFS